MSVFYGPFSFSRELLNQRCQAKFVLHQTGERSRRLQVQTQVYSRLFAVEFGMCCQSYYSKLTLRGLNWSLRLRYMGLQSAAQKHKYVTGWNEQSDTQNSRHGVSYIQSFSFSHSLCPSSTLCSIILCSSPSLKISSIWLTPTLGLSVCLCIRCCRLYILLLSPGDFFACSLKGLAVDLPVWRGSLTWVKPQTAAVSRACLMRMCPCIPEIGLSWLNGNVSSCTVLGKNWESRFYCLKWRSWISHRRLNKITCICLRFWQSVNCWSLFN